VRYKSNCFKTKSSRQIGKINEEGVRIQESGVRREKEWGFRPQSFSKQLIEDGVLNPMGQEGNQEKNCSFININSGS
jgi:hypothetical protein